MLKPKQNCSFLFGDLLNIIPTMQQPKLQQLVKQHAITAEYIDEMVITGIKNSWREVGACIRYGINAKNRTTKMEGTIN